MKNIKIVGSYFEKIKCSLYMHILVLRNNTIFLAIRKEKQTNKTITINIIHMLVLLLNQQTHFSMGRPSLFDFKTSVLYNYKKKLQLLLL